MQETRPYENEHACRLEPPGNFDSFARKNCDQKKNDKCIDVIYGIKGGKSEIQSLRFKKKIWTADAARKVCKARGGTFEAAKKTKGINMDEKIEKRCFLADEIRIEKREGKPTMLIGHAAVFNKLSEKIMGFREKIAPGAFADSLKDGDDVRCLFNHDSNLLLGRRSAKTLSLKEDKTGLKVEDDLPNTQIGRDIPILIERGDLTGMSFGFRTIDDEWHTENGEDVRTLKRVKLIDVSPATFPAYPDTSVAVRSHDEYLNRTVEQNKKKAASSLELMKMRLELAAKA